MSSRDKYIQQLWAYVDGELSEHDARELEQALAQDQALSKQCEQLLAIKKLVRSLPRQQAPQDFVARVVAQAERSTLVEAMPHQQYKPPLVWMRYVATAAVVLIAVGIGAAIVVGLARIPQVNMGQVRTTSSEHQLAQAWKDKKSQPAEAMGLPAERSAMADKYYKGLSAGVPVNLPARQRIAGAAEEDINIYADARNLPDAAESVKNILISNGIEPADTPVATISNQAILALPQWGNNFEVTRAGGQQIQISAYVPAEQVSQLRSQIDTAMQSQAMRQARDDASVNRSLGEVSDQDEFKSRGAGLAQATARPVAAAKTSHAETLAGDQLSASPAPAQQLARKQQYRYSNQSQNQFQDQNQNRNMIQARLIINLNSASQLQRVAPASNAASYPADLAQPN
jgi:anti-sigma factor RsiW